MHGRGTCPPLPQHTHAQTAPSPPRACVDSPAVGHGVTASSVLCVSAARCNEFARPHRPPCAIIHARTPTHATLPVLRDIDQTPHECVCTGFHSYRVIVHSLSQGDALLKADKHNFDDAITAWTRGASARLPPRALRTAVASGTRAPAFLHSAPPTCHGKQQILVIRNRRHVSDSSLAV